jgi:tripartite-type tricarboxylate transporter receptor subunit TctC
MRKQSFMGMFVVGVIALLVIGAGCVQAPAPTPTPTPKPPSAPAKAVPTATPVAKPKPTPAPTKPPAPKAWKPQKDIVWIVAYAPGGGFDAYSRGIARTMKKYLPKGLNVIVRNMPGGGGRLARTYMMRAKPDGYTLAILNAPSAVADTIIFRDEIDYDYAKYTYFGQVAAEPGLVTAAKHTGWKSIEDLKKATKPVRQSITGVGSIPFPIGVVLGELLGYPYTFVSGYKGSVAAMTGAVRGDADITIYNPSSMRSFIESGDLIPLVVLDEKRTSMFPDVPSAKELGLPEDTTRLDLVARYIYGPPNMPKPVVNYYMKLMPKVFNDPEFKDWAKKAKRPLSVAGPEVVEQAVKGWTKTYGKYEAQIKAAVKKLGG